MGYEELPSSIVIATLFRKIYKGNYLETAILLWFYQTYRLNAFAATYAIPSI